MDYLCHTQCHKSHEGFNSSRPFDPFRFDFNIIRFRHCVTRYICTSNLQFVNNVIVSKTKVSHPHPILFMSL